MRAPMSSRIRFTSAASVFEAFPELNSIAIRPADDIDPLDHARTLSTSSRPGDAIFFVSHLLPRRETVWWAIQCVRALLSESGEDEALRSAEAWVRTPDDENRRSALSVANACDRRQPTTWLAFAAGWSGGSLLAPDQKPVAAPAGACAMAANTAIMQAVASGDPLETSPRIIACAEAGIRFATGGEPTVLGLRASRQ
jgi:hypothetical protein